MSPTPAQCRPLPAAHRPSARPRPALIGWTAPSGGAGAALIGCSGSGRGGLGAVSRGAARQELPEGDRKSVV